MRINVPSLATKPIKAVLSLTRECNMSCSYCYAGASNKQNLSYQTARKAIDFILDRAHDGQKITFYFFGGEPLLRFDMVRQITAYIRNHDKSRNTHTEFALTTNGTLLSPEILEFFRKEQFRLCISMDGVEVAHNRHRRFESGLPTFREVVDNLQLSQNYLSDIQVNLVYGPETLLYLPESVVFIRFLGIDSLHLSPDITSAWPTDSFASLEAIFNRIADDYVAMYENEREMAIQPFDSKLIVLLKGGYDVWDTCRAGERDWSFSARGNIYACERFIGQDREDRFCLGNVYTGLSESQVSSGLCQHHLTDNRCRDCRISRYCMNWCACSNYHMTGDPHRVSVFLCENEKAVIKVSADILSRLQNNTLFLDHMITYMQAATA